MITQYVDRKSGHLQFWSPDFKTLDNSHKFFIIDLVITLGKGVFWKNMELAIEH